MKHFFKLSSVAGIFLVGLSMCSFANAAMASATKTNEGATFAHEISGGTDSVFSFAGGATSIGFNVGYRYYLLPDLGLQIGYDTNFSYNTAADSGATVWSNIFGLRYNIYQLGQSMMNQFFVDLGIGFELNHGSFGSVSTSSTNFQFRVGVGKRVALFENVAWIPELRETDTANQGWAFEIIPIAVSVAFGPSS